MTAICEYGCNRPATHTFKSGKVCCSAATSSCPAMIAENRNKMKMLRTDKGNSYWKNGHPRGYLGKSTLKGKTYEDIHGLDNAIKLKNKLSHSLKGFCSWDKLDIATKNTLSQNQSNRMLARYEAGLYPRAGRCEKIRYVSPTAGDVLLDGTWELIAAQYMDALEWKWSRNKQRFKYTNLSGKISHYTPDFYVSELGGYLEIKGYETDLDRCKWSQFEQPLTVWKKDKISNIKSILKNLKTAWPSPPNPLNH